MQEFQWVTGIILKQTPIGEYDRRICLLTKEKGKISAFVRGARKQGSRFAAATNSFAFGTFKLYAGRYDEQSNTIWINESIRNAYKGKGVNDGRF